MFPINRSYSWQSIDLFLGLFSSFGRSLNWEVDDPPKFVHICNYFMTYKRFVIDMFCVPFPQNYCHMFPENQFCEVFTMNCYFNENPMKTP